MNVALNISTHPLTVVPIIYEHILEQYHTPFNSSVDYILEHCRTPFNCSADYILVHCCIPFNS